MRTGDQKPSRRTGWLTLALLCVVVGAPCLQVARELRQQRLNTDLIRAIKAKDALEVESLLTAGADPASRDFGRAAPTFLARLHTMWDEMRGVRVPAPVPGPTALALAVRADSAAIVKSLLAGRTLDVNQTASFESDGQPYNSPLLARAAEQGNFEMVRVLLDHGARTEMQDDDYHTALFNAVSHREGDTWEETQLREPALVAKYMPVVQLLLDRGADPNTMDAYQPILLDALQNPRESMVESLLAHGADPNSHNTHAPALAYAAQSGNGALVRRLLKLGAKVNPPAKLDPPLTYAYDPAILQLLLKAGAYVNAVRGDGWKYGGFSALDMVVSADSRDDGYARTRLEAVRILLAHGADSRNAFTLAAEYADAKVLRCLLDHGARLDSQALFGAADPMDEDDDKMELLLDRGADPNVRDEEGATPLMCAAETGDDSIVAALLDAGADAAARNKAGETALSIAIRTDDEHGNGPVIALLKKAIALRRAAGETDSRPLRRRASGSRR